VGQTHRGPLRVRAIPVALSPAVDRRGCQPPVGRLGSAVGRRPGGHLRPASHLPRPPRPVRAGQPRSVAGRADPGRGSAHLSGGRTPDAVHARRPGVPRLVRELLAG